MLCLKRAIYCAENLFPSCLVYLKYLFAMTICNQSSYIRADQDLARLCSMLLHSSRKLALALS